LKTQLAFVNEAIEKVLKRKELEQLIYKKAVIAPLENQN
jgi:hypothetical protein